MGIGIVLSAWASGTMELTAAGQFRNYTGFPFNPCGRAAGTDNGGKSKGLFLERDNSLVVRWLMAELPRFDNI